MRIDDLCLRPEWTRDKAAFKKACEFAKLAADHGLPFRPALAGFFDSRAFDLLTPEQSSWARREVLRFRGEIVSIGERCPGLAFQMGLI